MNTEILKALGLAEDGSEEQVIEAIAVLHGRANTPPPKPDLSATAKLLGLAEDADSNTVNAAVAQLKADFESTAGLSADQLDRFRAAAIRGQETERKLAQLEEDTKKRLHDEERETLLARAVDDGRITPAQKEEFAALYDVAPAQTKATIEGFPKKSFRAVGSIEPAPSSRSPSRA